MLIQARKSIKEFLKELKNRIELLSSNQVTANIDNANINAINQVLKKYNLNSASSTSITPSTIKQMQTGDIKDLLMFTNTADPAIDYLLTHLDQEETYAKIASTIKKYIEEFMSIGLNQTTMFNDKIGTYQKYITLFEKEENFACGKVFEEFNELSKIMSEVGLSDENKWPILEYVAIMNQFPIDTKYFDISTKINIEYAKVEEYLTSQNESIIVDYLNNNSVDIDIIPTIARNLAASLDLPVEVIINILSVMIASGLYDNLINVDKEMHDEYLDNIAFSLSFVKPLKDPLIYQAISIKKNTEEFFFNSVNNQGITNQMINEYLDTPISLIESSNNVSRETAIEYKELAVLKPIYETIDTISSMSPDTDEYKKALNILSKLIEQYNLLENKKIEISNRIN